MGKDTVTVAVNEQGRHAGVMFQFALTLIK